MKHPSFLVSKDKEVRPLRGWRSLILGALLIFGGFCIRASNDNSDCNQVFVKKVTDELGDAYQSDVMTIDGLPNPNTETLSFWAFKNINGEIKLTFKFSSDVFHFTDEGGDTLLVVLYGPEVKNKLVRYRSEGKEAAGGKYNSSISFRMEEKLAADIVKNKDNRVNFDLGTYKIVLNDEMYCILKQMLKAKL